MQNDRATFKVISTYMNMYEKYRTQATCNAYFGTKIMLQEKIKDADEEGGGN